MGTSTNGQICFGYLFDEGYEFPWDTEEFDGDIEKWWLSVSGFKPSVNPFTQDRELAPGFTEGDPRIEIYFQESRDWLKNHPCPISEVNYQSADCPAYIIAVPSSVKTARRGDPEPFEPLNLVFNPKDLKSFMDTCTIHGIISDTPVDWYLSSYWG